MDWSDKVQEMMQSWTKTQQKMWSGWLESMQGMGRSPTQDLWAKTVDTWEESVKNTLEAQSTWMSIWAESLESTAGTPDSVSEWAQRSKEGMKRWHESQQQLWQRWFEVLRHSAPGAAQASPEDAERMLREWQAHAHEALEAQIQIVTAWKNKGMDSR